MPPQEESAPSAAARADAVARPPKSCLRKSLAYGVIGGLTAALLVQFKLDSRHDPLWLAAGTLAAAALGVTGARAVVWVAAISTLAGLLLIGFTPLVPWLTSGTSVSDPMQSSPAIVVLGAGSHLNNTPNASARDRLLKGGELLKAAVAARNCFARGIRCMGLFHTRSIGRTWYRRTSGPYSL